MFDETAIDKLVRRAKNGDQRAFTAIYDEYAQRLYAYVRQRLDSDTEAEDVTAIVFMRAFEALPRYDRREVPFAAWVFRIARNCIIDTYRKSQRTVTTSPIDEALDVPDDSNVESAVLASATAEQIRSAMRRISDDHAEVLELRFFSDLSIAETARVMERTEGATKALQVRAIASLARALSGEVSG